MSGTADPYEPPCMPVFLGRTQRTPTVERVTGPERTATEPPPDDWTPPPPVGFAPTALTRPHRET